MTTAFLISKIYGKLRVITPEGKIFTGVIESDVKLRDQSLKTLADEKLRVEEVIKSERLTRVIIAVRIDKENRVYFDFQGLVPGAIHKINGRNSSDGRFNSYRGSFATDSTDGFNPLM